MAVPQQPDVDGLVAVEPKPVVVANHSSDQLNEGDEQRHNDDNKNGDRNGMIERVQGHWYCKGQGRVEQEANDSQRA